MKINAPIIIGAVLGLLLAAVGFTIIPVVILAFFVPWTTLVWVAAGLFVTVLVIDVVYATIVFKTFAKAF